MQQPAAGWYPDPAQRGQRWWDGAQWTAHFVPYAPPTPGAPKGASSGDWIGGVLLSLLIPIVGLIAGVVYVVIGGPRRAVGLTCIALSLLAALFWIGSISSPS